MHLRSSNTKWTWKNISWLLWRDVHMLNLIKMDLRRTFRTPLLYALLLGLGVMLGTFAMTGVMGENQSIAALIGPVSSTGDMMSTMGMSMVLIFGAIYIVSIIGKDFSTGFIKNILTIHANKSTYIMAKLVVGTIASACMLVFYVVLMVILGMIQGLPLGIPSIGGLVLFLLGKLLLAIALNALLIGFELTFRNLPISILACFMFGMGGATMLLSMLGNSLNIPILHTISTFTIAGSSSIGTLTVAVGDIVHIVICGVAWLVFSLITGCFIMKRKDV
ncbi:MAG: hypothetical protein EOM40_05935 [Clostridia bacterium]|nr:hypothetical protein [Clostridia bacterium]NCC44096.1 hypothetical protein [Clostridia bacterium]